jgi:hypothetical protein
MKTLFRELKSWERVFLFLLLLLFPILSFLDSNLIHPGYCEIDEGSPLRHAWIWLQGSSLQPTLFTGFFHRLAVAVNVILFGNRRWILQLPSQLAFLLECFLLQRLVSRLFGTRAAFGALCFNLLSAFSLARSRAVLCYALLPCEMLLILNLATHSARVAWRGWLAGLLAGLFFLEYEAWPVAYLCLAMAAVALKDRLLLKGLPLFLGSLIGLTVVIVLSREGLASYFAIRGAFTLGGKIPSDLAWGANLLRFFTGGHVLPSMGVENHPALAPWTWPVLILGILAAWKKEKWLLIAVVVGVLPLLAPSAGLTEANRGIAAWPALGLLAGLGWAALPDKKWLQVFLAVWLAAGAYVEASAFFRSQELLAPENYAWSTAQIQAGRWLELQAHQQPIRLLSNLGYERESELEWASGIRPTRSANNAGRVIAWIPWEAVPALGNDAGTWTSFSDPKNLRHILLLEPNPRWSARLVRVDGDLKRYMAQLNSYGLPENLIKIKNWLDTQANLDPWVRTVLWQKWMTDASIISKVEDSDINALLKEKLIHAGPLNYPSYYLARSRPDLSLRLKKRAEILDPRLKDRP